MRSKLLSLLTIMLAGVIHAQDVTSLEYYVDTDPGYGLATKLTLTPGANITHQFNLALVNASAGFHVVGFRASDNTRWSHTYMHSFMVIPQKPTQVTATEYFIDNDPGEGKATAISKTFANGILNDIIPLTNLDKGFHLIGIRTRDDQNAWSHTFQHMVHVEDQSSARLITALEYYYSGANATGTKYTYNVTTPAVQVDLNFRSDLSQLTPDSSYTIHIVAITGDGKRSQEVSKAFKVNAMVTAVNDVMEDGFVFRQNSPNPVQNSTWFNFELPVFQKVTLTLYDMNGRFIREVHRASLNPGKHNIRKDFSDLKHGIYTVLFRSEKYMVALKMVR